MTKQKKSSIEVKGTEITILSSDDGDHISLTDMLKAKDGEFFISDWLGNRNTVEFLGIWESIYNPAFNSGEFAIIKSQAANPDRNGTASIDRAAVQTDVGNQRMKSARADRRES